MKAGGCILIGILVSKSNPVKRKTNAKSFGNSSHRLGDYGLRSVCGGQLAWDMETEYGEIEVQPLPPRSRVSLPYGKHRTAGVKVTTTGVQAGGAAINASYIAKYDGNESPVTGAPYDTISIKQVNANTLTFTASEKRMENTTYSAERRLKGWQDHDQHHERYER